VDINVLQRAYEREKERRKQAEALLEEKSRELFLSYEKLDRSHTELEKTHAELQHQQAELVQLINAYASVTDDLHLAAKLQADLLPEPLLINGLEATGYFQPASFVAGDAYDYFMLSDNIFAFYIIDVEGHGTASAMTSFAIHSQLNPKYEGICKRSLNTQPTHSDAVLATINELNSAFYNPESSNKYFTMIYGLLDLATGEMTWCQAGHPAIIVCSESGVSELGNGGFPVGALEQPSFTTSCYTLQPKERIAIYSDGVVECFSKSQEMFGKERLLNLLGESANQTQKTGIKKIKDTLQAWNTSNDFADDVTLLLIDYQSTHNR